MTTLSPILGLAAELQRQLATKRDLVADTRRVSLALADPNPELGGFDETHTVVPGVTQARLLVDLDDRVEEFGVTRYAHQQVAEHLGVPWKLYDRLLHGAGKKKPPHPDLLLGLANGLLSREPETRLLRVLDGNVRGFLSDRYRPRDNWDLLERAVLPVLAGYPDVVFRRCELTETRMYVKVSLPQFERPVTPKVDDVVQGGVIVSNSEVGAGSLLVAPYTHRLICRNGMVHVTLGQRRIHVGRRLEGEGEAWEFFSDETLRLDDEAFFAKCADTVRGVLNATIFDKIVEQMRELAGVRIAGSPPAAVEIIAKRQGFTEGEQGSILEHLVEGGDLSAWGYVNAITTTARDHENADRGTELEMIAGRMVASPDWLPAVA